VFYYNYIQSMVREKPERYLLAYNALLLIWGISSPTAILGREESKIIMRQRKIINHQR